MTELLISDDDLDVLLDAANPVELASLSTVAITRALVELREASLAPADSPAPTWRCKRAVPRMRFVGGARRDRRSRPSAACTPGLRSPG